MWCDLSFATKARDFSVCETYRYKRVISGFVQHAGMSNGNYMNIEREVKRANAYSALLYYIKVDFLGTSRLLLYPGRLSVTVAMEVSPRSEFRDMAEPGCLHSHTSRRCNFHYSFSSLLL
ncbi:hypothetical protein PoB_002449200 [Plakobranchus ocellatus]|uniref:Uncharacterized protein n=1 Tax=Plakobranchus ocellatus TaxID=259542 RepID=A0AAV3ZTW6_9GAST|nr:hypothetical protein PoB_002449200 [Plakobranchus ocellatus]